MTNERTCPHCDGAVQLGRIICPHCGRVLPAESVESAPKEPTDDGQPGAAPPPMTPPGATPPAPPPMTPPGPGAPSEPAFEMPSDDGTPEPPPTAYQPLEIPAAPPPPDPQQPAWQTPPPAPGAPPAAEGYQPPGTPPQAPPPAPPRDDTMGIIGLILSIAGTVLCCCFPATVLAPIGLILSIVANNRRSSGVTITGIIIGAVGTLLFLVSLAWAIYTFTHPEMQQQMLEEFFKGMDLPLPPGFPAP